MKKIVLIGLLLATPVLAQTPVITCSDNECNMTNSNGDMIVGASQSGAVKLQAGGEEMSFNGDFQIAGDIRMPSGSTLTWRDKDNTEWVDILDVSAVNDTVSLQSNSGRDVALSAGGTLDFILPGGTARTLQYDGATGDGLLCANTADASDSSSFCFAGGGACSTGRGGHVITYGNENASDGDVLIRAGNASGSEVYIQTSASGGNIQFAAGTGSSRDLLITQNLVDFETDSGNNLGIPRGTDLPDSPAAGYLFLDTNDGACDDANDSGGTAVCLYSGAAWILLGNTGS